MHKLLPGKRLQGIELPDRRKLTYKLNGTPLCEAHMSCARLQMHSTVATPVWTRAHFAGLRCCLVTVAIVAGLGFGTDYLRLGWIYDNFTALMTAAMLLSLVSSVSVYLSSFGIGRLLSSAGHTG